MFSVGKTNQSRCQTNHRNTEQEASQNSIQQTPVSSQPQTEADIIKARIRELELESEKIREQNRKMKLENRQLLLEHQLMKEEKRIFTENPELVPETETEDDVFADYFTLNQQERIFLESKNIVKKIVWENQFLKLTANENFIVLIVPRESLKDEEIRAIDNRIQIRTKKQVNTGGYFEKLSDVVIFNHIIPYLKIPEVQSLLRLNKSINKRFTPNLKTSLLSKLENSIIFNKYAKFVCINAEHQQEMAGYLLKLQNYCHQFFLKVKIDIVSKLANDSKIGKDVQQFVICILKFFFEEQLKLEKLRNYMFLDWQSYFCLFELLLKHIRSVEENAKSPECVFDLADYPKSHEKLRTILFPEAFNKETSKKMQIFYRIGKPQCLSKLKEFQNYSSSFVVCTEFELDLKDRDAAEIITPLFLRSVAKMLQVIEIMKRRMNYLNTCLGFSQKKLDRIENEDIPPQMFKNFMTQFVNNKFDIANQCQNVDMLQNKLKDLALHSLTILRHLKNNSLKDFFLVDAFLNFPREFLEFPSTRKIVVDCSLSVIQAVHKMKKLDTILEFNWFYELIHAKIFEMIQKNNREIMRNEEIKQINTLKIKAIENKINQNQQKIHGKTN